jgi:hypothetical protein
MSLRVLCCFSHLTGPDGWQDPHHCVNQFVNAVKGRPLSGYAYVRLFPDAPRRRLDAMNAQEAVDWFGEMGAEMLVSEGLDAAPVFVPIPNSQCVVATPSSRTRHLADALAYRFGDSLVLDVLRFDQPMHSAHGQQGSRDARSLYLHMRLTEALHRDRPHVLVDDVVATGGHIAAAQAVLRAYGAEVAVAVCAASAERTPHPAPFDRVVRQIAGYQPSDGYRWMSSLRR